MIQDLRFYLSLFMRRIHYFLLLAALGTAVGITLAMILPPKYNATARLVVESEQIPDELASSTVDTQALERLQIIQQRILSRENLLEMANRLNIYPRDPSQPGQALRPDMIVRDLRERITMTIPNISQRRDDRQATIVEIGFSAASPQLASAVANEVVTLILDENVRMRTGATGQTLDFFQQEVERLDKELSARRARIVQFQEENKAALPDSLEFRREQYALGEERLLQLKREQQTLQDRKRSFQAMYEATGTLGEDEEPATAEGRELLRLKERYASSGGGLDIDNPRLRVMRDRIDALEEIVATQEDQAIAEGDATPTTPYEIQMAEIDAQLADIVDDVERIGKQQTELRTTIDATPSNAIALETLQRDFESVQRQYDTAVQSRGRAETGDLIESLAKGERISIIEQAVPPREPSSPNRPKLMVAGAGGGILAGLGLIVLLELLNNTIRRPVEIVSRLDIAPLATLPYIRTRSEIRRRRALIVGAALIAVVGIPISLWAINEFYLPLDLIWEKVIDRLELGRIAMLPVDMAAMRG
ncbi:Wzz/FepE/Etk N-terminal domain-containing protein [Paracoccus sp. TK19116]|uniref:Wzz/FepE/Etk N-terminal domain-containing protein n=1 Tax=Paracoccus albicereus TaxID=2922394 RepID=A0ABT1MN56_9RHOB|nr:Wzz/FepE/Etk N-terminal domain-containing protein [Paracoccus albicereus]MCQ0969702.1 Wzz/FepE/Etk N-terminal domain-containing protein [Paracoccus albicereus]